MMESVLLDCSHPFMKVSQFLRMGAPVHPEFDSVSELFPDITLFEVIKIVHIHAHMKARKKTPPTK